MLRYFAYSTRDFREVPDLSDHRLNWEVWVTFSGRVRPRFRTAPRRVLPEANFWVLPPGARYRWVADDREVERAVFHFAYIPHELERLVQRQGYLARWLQPEGLAAAREVAESVDESCRQRTRLSPLRFQRAALDLALIALAGEADAAAPEMDTPAVDRAERAVAWYRAHVREGPKFSRLADELHTSVSHLRRLFRQHYGLNPKAVLDKVRLDWAAHLLASTRSTLDVIAREAGFRSSTDLCRVFRKHYGHPPNVWRRTVGVFDPDLVPRNSPLREADLQRLVARPEGAHHPAATNPSRTNPGRDRPAPHGAAVP